MTVPQALALYQMARSSDQMNSDFAGDLTPAMVRALAVLEDGIEAVRGHFENRITERKAEARS